MNHCCLSGLKSVSRCQSTDLSSCAELMKIFFHSRSLTMFVLLLPGCSLLLLDPLRCPRFSTEYSFACIHSS
jgi:hypothetical protein